MSDEAAPLAAIVADEDTLRHPSDLPVVGRGAKVIAAGGPFANLTRLELASCALREKGTKALVGSTALGNLTVLDLSNNNAGRGAIKLANPKTFPRRGHCALNRNRNRLPKGQLTRLRAPWGERLAPRISLRRTRAFCTDPIRNTKHSTRNTKYCAA